MKIKNKILKDVTIESVAAEGKCVARHEGQVIFVKDVAPGDVCDIRITRKKKSFLEAVPVAIHEFSDKRTEPFCEHYGTCGGCKWQHLEYQAQLSFKEQQVIDNLERIGHLQLGEVHPIIGSEEKQYYRNKLEYTFSDVRWFTKEEISREGELEPRALGFHIPGRFDKILDINHCYLQPDPSNAIRLAVKEYGIKHDIPFFNLRKQTGFLRNLIIRTASTGQCMVILQVTSDKREWIDPIMDLVNEFEQVTSANYVVNNKGNDTYGDLDVINVHGTPYIEEQMKLPESGDVITFRVGPKSFYQTNAHQAEVLYKRAWEMAKISKNDVVYDLYTGTGTIANYVAPSAKRVVGVEYIAAAIDDAKVNSSINGIENTTFYAGDMKDIMTDYFIQENGKPDIIITDPPRAGMHPDVCDVLLRSGAKRIVYVSCNPATQARDLQMLSEKYTVDEVQPVDMFPHTHHVENIVRLELKA